MKITAFATDENKENKGIWKDIAPGVSLLVARDKNSEYVAMLRKEMEPFALSMSDMEDSKAEGILIKVIAHTVLLDWRGLTDDDENLIPYTVETALEWLTNYKEFRKLVSGISQDLNNYRNKVIKKEQEEIKKQ